MKTVSTTLSNEQPNTYNIYVEPDDVINSLYEKIKEKDEEIKYLEIKFFVLEIICTFLLFYIVIL